MSVGTRTVTTWADFDLVPRGTSPDPEIPPHAALCIKHSKLYRGVCPFCVHESMYPGTELEQHEPRFYMRGKKRCNAPRRKRRDAPVAP